MADAFILGAGFSRAISSAMPLLSELDMAVSFLAESPFLSSAVDDVYKLLDNLGDMESLLTYLAQEHPWLRPEENEVSRALFSACASGIWQFMVLRQDAVFGKIDESDVGEEIVEKGALQRPPLWLLELLRTWEKTKATVVTFNYDVLVEKAYRAGGAPEYASGYSHADLYPIPISSIQSRNDSLILRADKRSTFSYIKLHGSLSWYHGGYGSEVVGPLYDGLCSSWEPDGNPREAYSSDLFADLQPLIVPPTTEKSSFFRNPTLRAQWAIAGKRLRAADRVFFLGYSLPQSDHMVRFLLAPLTAGKEVGVVGLCPSDAEREQLLEHYQTVLPSAHVSVEHSLRESSIPAFVDWYARQPD